MHRGLPHRFAFIALSGLSCSAMMTGPAGQPTNAISVWQRHEPAAQANPEYLICVFDPRGPTFRDHLYDHTKPTLPHAR